jgi:sugar phosphate isomerase/epimerase
LKRDAWGPELRRSREKRILKIGVLTVLFQQMSLEETLDYVKEVGAEAVELGTGNYPGNAHCDPAKLLADESELKSLTEAIEDRDLMISGLSCHGNPLHPQGSIAKEHHEVFERTVLLAEKLGVDRVIGFSGCPGGSEDSKYPNWVTCPWPDDFSEIVEWQWKEKVIPYWKDAGDFAESHGVRICFEMHPGFVVYNTGTLLRLREEVGNVIGANFDPSHLFWQGMDPLRCVRKLGDAIYHVHAKDTAVDAVNTEVNGTLDTTPYSDEINRSWIFRTVGYGHPVSWWKDFVSELRMNGYDYVLSIEHEDSLMSAGEGFRKAFATLKEAVIEEEAGAMWWA